MTLTLAKAGKIASRHALLIILLALTLILSIASPTFRQPSNLINIVEQQSIIGVVAAGMLLMILLGGFDLSVGSVGAASSVLAAYLMSQFGIVPGVLGALVVGLIVGTANGVLIAVIGINPFVITLGMQVLVSGLLMVATNAGPVYGVPEEFTFFGLGRIGPIPMAAVTYAVVVFLVWVVLSKTVFGRHIYATGGNIEAARLAGIRTSRVTISVYALGSLAAAIGGLILLGQTSIGQPAAAAGWPLSAIAAVAIAGVPLTGGVGGIRNVVIGTLLLGVIGNALNQFGISPYWQPAITGAVIIGAVAIDTIQRRKRT
ncbi:MAG: ABC transporter permease [Propionibacteriaceae bacterium]|jgi:ribose/xylose/arabinose/galactoside ABC-type transport system permease subunit|nr:ABC transporter permease [Propionibacteriaceae bacterium]